MKLLAKAFRLIASLMLIVGLLCFFRGATSKILPHKEKNKILTHAVKIREAVSDQAYGSVPSRPPIVKPIVKPVFQLPERELQEKELHQEIDSLKRVVKQVDSLRRIARVFVLTKRFPNELPPKMSIAQAKGLIEKRYGWYLDIVCERLRIMDQRDTLLSLLVHESGADPIAQNKESFAEGLGQWLLSSAKVKGPEYGIDSVDRRNPYVNIWITACYFAENRAKLGGKTDNGILAHWAGPGEASAILKSGMVAKNHPFVRLVKGVAKIKAQEPPQKALDRLKRIEVNVCGAVPQANGE
jgi:hypothetical protein